MASIPVLRSTLALSALTITLAFAVPASAQMYPGEGVTVNPGAIGANPCTGARSRKLKPVRLHMPRKRRHMASAEAPAPAAPLPQAEAPQAEAPVAAAPMRQAIAKVPPSAPPPAGVPESAPASIPFSFGGSRSAAAPPAAAPASAKAQPAPARTASAAPLPKVALDKGLTKQASVLFDVGSSELSDTSSARLNDLAFSLKTALASGASQIELMAYGGDPGDRSSDARRISLKRALAVREALIVDGVPANRIDVRALGGVDPNDNGATDRVDIFVKA